MIAPEGPNSLIERMNEIMHRFKKLNEDFRQFQRLMTLPLSRPDSDDESEAAKGKKFNPFPGRLQTILRSSSIKDTAVKKVDKDLQVIEEAELMKDVGLRKIYLHPFSQTVRQGKYF